MVRWVALFCIACAALPDGVGSTDTDEPSVADAGLDGPDTDSPPLEPATELLLVSTTVGLHLYDLDLELAGVPAAGALQAELDAAALDWRVQAERTLGEERDLTWWLIPSNTRFLQRELDAHPGAVAVHLVLGFEEFLRVASEPGFLAMDPDVQTARFDDLAEDLGALVDALHEIRSDVLVVLGEVDLLDVFALSFDGWFTNGVTNTAAQDALGRWGVARRRTLLSRENTAYLPGFGAFQHDASPSLPAPGGPPTWEPVLGGDPVAGLPPAAHEGDGRAMSPAAAALHARRLVREVLAPFDAERGE